MCGLIHKLHELIKIGRPQIENLIGLLVSGEVDDASQAVYLGVDGLLDNQFGEEILRFLGDKIWEVKQVIIMHYSYLCDIFGRPIRCVTLCAHM